MFFDKKGNLTKRLSGEKRGQDVLNIVDKTVDIINTNIKTANETKASLNEQLTPLLNEKKYKNLCLYVILDNKQTPKAIMPAQTNSDSSYTSNTFPSSMQQLYSAIDNTLTPARKNYEPEILETIFTFDQETVAKL